jgi:hypothetical protein
MLLPVIKLMSATLILLENTYTKVIYRNAEALVFTSGGLGEHLQVKGLWGLGHGCKVNPVSCAIYKCSGVVGRIGDPCTTESGASRPWEAWVHFCPCDLAPRPVLYSF